MLSLDGLLGVKVSPPFFLRRGGQTQKSSDLLKYKLSGRGGLLNSEKQVISTEAVFRNQLKSKNLEGRKFRG